MKRFIFLLLLLGCLDAYSQKAAIRVNALSGYILICFEIIFVLISFSFRFNLYFCPVSKMR